MSEDYGTVRYPVPVAQGVFFAISTVRRTYCTELHDIGRWTCVQQPLHHPLSWSSQYDCQLPPTPTVLFLQHVPENLYCT